jgi:hypothetical protein
MADYIIVNKTDLKKKLKELEYSRNVEPDNQMQSYLDGQIKSLEIALKESIPLNGEIRKAFCAGKNTKTNMFSEQYISSLKLDI